MEQLRAIDQEDRENNARAVFVTLAYFAVVRHSMTATDAWRWMVKHTCSLQDVHVAIQDLVDRGMAARDGAFVVLTGHDRVDDHERYLASERKHRIARRFSRWLMCVPGIRAAGVCNSLAWNLAKEDSDIDFFVITRPGAMWLARLLATLPLIVLRRRPGQKSRDPICLSYFVTTRQMDLSLVRPVKEDIHGAHWTYSILPLFGDEAFKTFFRQNRWVNDLFPNATPPVLAQYRLSSSRWTVVGRWIDGALRVSLLARPLERIARAVQRRQLPLRIRERMNQSTDVIVTNDMLKFHTTDKRQERHDQWQKLQKTIPL